MVWRRLVFWWVWLRETLTTRRIAPLVAARLHEPLHVNGLEHLPHAGWFTLAVNHYTGRATFDTLAAVLQALGQARPDAVAAMLFILGQRSPPPHQCVVRWQRRLLAAIYQRWSAHGLPIALKNPQPSVVGRRGWQQLNQPIFVFPEGRGSVNLQAMRRSVGHWLRHLRQLVIPVVVWWEPPTGWQVRRGAPLRWTPRPTLSDLQLGLALAALLPPELAPDWQTALARWRAAHQGSVRDALIQAEG